MKDLFDLSIAAGGEYSHLLVKKPEYQDLVTFAQCKRRPIYNWFYYKEGFSPELVWDLLERFQLPPGSTVLDPFCGTGNTLLACKQRGFDSVGSDILPLGVFVSNVKVEQDYDFDLLYEGVRKLTSFKFGESSFKWPDLGFIDAKKAFNRYARKDILFFKERISEVEDEKIRNFLLLGLMSIVLQASNVKRDGGVLRFVQKRHQPPVRHLLKSKLKRMFKDLKRSEPFPPGVSAEAVVGDARHISLPPDSVDCCITSPPYLNWIDYTKVYGLELAVLVKPSDDLKAMRARSLRSHVGAEDRKKIELRSERVKEIMEKVSESEFVKKPQVIEGYFEDMYSVLSSLHKVLKEGGRAALVVGNVCLPNMTVDTDLILAEIGEDIGFSAEEVLVAHTRWCDVRGIRKERPVRESVVVLRK